MINMLPVLQSLTIVGMIGATFFVYQTFGPRQLSFTFTRGEKSEWDNLVKGRLGSWLTICSIFATITSFATVYVFFIGNARHFGWWIVFSVVTIWGGGFITNYFTRILVSRRHISKRLASGDQSRAVLLTLVLDGTNESILSASIVRVVALTNILAILWLEFSVFADVSSKLIISESILWGTIFLYGCAFAVLYFTLRFGLRGFLFADLFHGPIIVIGTLTLLIGTVVFLVGIPSAGGHEDRLAKLLGKIFTEMNAPFTEMNAQNSPASKASLLGGLLFTISCIFLNSFLVLITQPHWFRVWMFGEKETTLQVTSLSITAVVWSTLILIGALASIVVTEVTEAVNIREATDICKAATLGGSVQVVVCFLQQVTDANPLIAVAFWLAGVGALFSTADAQIYSFFSMHRFNLREGKIAHAEFKELRPAFYAATAAAMFAGCYALVRFLEVDFDQLVFVLLPSCLNIVPALILAVRGIRQEPILLWISILPYAGCALLGLLNTDVAPVFAVAAPLMPLIVSVVALVYMPKEVAHAKT
jgi:hypothetical protein